MATLKAFIRTGKKDGIVNVRFRLSDGRSVQLFHKSEITVLSSLWDDKLERHKTRSLVKEKERAALTIAIANRKRLIEDLYKANKLITSSELDLLIDKNLNPQKYNIQTEDLTVIGLFKKYVSSWIEKGVIGEGRKKHYDVVIRELTRFFVINSMDDFMPEEFTKDVIFAFREFLRNEYTFVETYDYLYAGMNARNRPSRERSQNTISEKLLLLQAFFAELEADDVIYISPFRKISKKDKNPILKQQYDEPIYLTIEEYNKILQNPCPDNLKRTRDLFIVQCNLGCRIGDFRSLTANNISVKDNIPYIHYWAKKTSKEGDTRKEIETPIMRTSFDIIKSYRNTLATDILLPFFAEGNSANGYNSQLKKLLEYYEINRLVSVLNKETKAMEYLPINTLASSKLARKTHVDMMNKVQINKYVSGLHKEGSEAVNRYTNLELKDRFALMNVAFNEQPYKVDDNLNIVE